MPGWIGDGAIRRRWSERRHCEERSDEAIQLSFFVQQGELLRSARNDGVKHLA